MMSILKTFGLGLLCTILSPLILVVFVLYFIYSLIGIIIMFFITVYRYFAKGGSVLDELEIEKKAKQILKNQEEQRMNMYNNIAPQTYLNGNNSSPVTDNYINYSNENNGGEQK